MARPFNTIGIQGDLDSGPGAYVHSDIAWIGDPASPTGEGSPASVAYREGDVVSFDGRLWVANEDNDNRQPGVPVARTDDQGNQVLISIWDQQTTTVSIQDANARLFRNFGFGASALSDTFTISFVPFGGTVDDSVRAAVADALLAFNAPPGFTTGAFLTEEEISIRVFDALGEEAIPVVDINGAPLPFIVPPGATIRASIQANAAVITIANAYLVTGIEADRRLPGTLPTFGVASSVEARTPLELDSAVRFRPTNGLEAIVSGTSPNRIASFGVRDGGIDTVQLADESVDITKISSEIATIHDVTNADFITKAVQQTVITGTQHSSESLATEETLVLTLPNDYDSGLTSPATPRVDILDLVGPALVPDTEGRTPVLASSGATASTSAYNFILSDQNLNSQDPADYTSANSIPGGDWNQVRSIYMNFRTAPELAASFRAIRGTSGQTNISLGSFQVVVYVDRFNWGVYNITGLALGITTTSYALLVAPAVASDGVIGGTNAIRIYSDLPGTLTEATTVGGYSVDVDTEDRIFNAANFTGGGDPIVASFDPRQNAIQALDEAASAIVARWGTAGRIAGTTGPVISARPATADPVTGLSTVELRTGVSSGNPLVTSSSITGINTNLPTVTETNTVTQPPVITTYNLVPPIGNQILTFTVPEGAVSLSLQVDTPGTDPTNLFSIIPPTAAGAPTDIGTTETGNARVFLGENLSGLWTVGIPPGGVFRRQLTAEVTTTRTVGFLDALSGPSNSIYTLTSPQRDFTASFAVPTNTSRADAAIRIRDSINSRLRTESERRSDRSEFIEWTATTRPTGLTTELTITSVTPTSLDRTDLSNELWSISVDHGSNAAALTDPIVIPALRFLGPGGRLIDSLSTRSPIDNGVITTVPDYPEGALSPITYGIQIDPDGNPSWTGAANTFANPVPATSDLPILRTISIDGINYLIQETAPTTNARLEYADTSGPFTKYAGEQTSEVNLVLTNIARGTAPASPLVNGQWEIPDTILIAFANDDSRLPTPTRLNDFGGVRGPGIVFEVADNGVNMVTIPIRFQRDNDQINALTNGITVEISGTVADQAITDQEDPIVASFVVQALDRLVPPRLDITSSPISRPRLAGIPSVETTTFTFNNAQAAINEGTGFAWDTVNIASNVPAAASTIFTGARDHVDYAFPRIKQDVDLNFMFTLVGDTPLPNGRMNPHGQTRVPGNIVLDIDRYAPLLFLENDGTAPSSTLVGDYTVTPIGVADSPDENTQSVLTVQFTVTPGQTMWLGVLSAERHAPDHGLVGLGFETVPPVQTIPTVRTAVVNFPTIVGGNDVDQYDFYNFGVVPAGQTSISITVRAFVNGPETPTP